MNKALLDTDILSEIGKGIDPNVARNAAAYRKVFGRYTLSVITIMEVVRGLQQKQSVRRLQGFLSAIASEEVLPLDQAAAELAGRSKGVPAVETGLRGIAPASRGVARPIAAGSRMSWPVPSPTRQNRIRLSAKVRRGGRMSAGPAWPGISLSRPAPQTCNTPVLNGRPSS